METGNALLTCRLSVTVGPAETQTLELSAVRHLLQPTSNNLKALSEL